LVKEAGALHKSGKGAKLSTSCMNTARLWEEAEAQLPGALEWLRRMVECNSFSGNAEGVNAVGTLTAAMFEPLGFRAERVRPAEPNRGDHWVLTRPGRGGPRVGLVSHLDTVFPPEEEQRNGFRWCREGDRIYGPGTVDNKGGTVAMFLMLQVLRRGAPEWFERVDWTLLFNGAEEVLSPDFGRLARGRLAGAAAALVFEGGQRRGEAWTLVTSRKGRAVFRIRVEGRGAHAGTRPERGANAVVQLAETVLRAARVTDWERSRSVNVGWIRGGTAVNRVPEEAEAEVEMRALDPAVFAEGKAALLALAGIGGVRARADGHPCRVCVDLLQEMPPWPDQESTERLFRSWETAGHELGWAVERETRGGLSDANYLWDLVPTLDGLGPVGDNAHCSERSPDGSKEPEYVLAGSFVPKTVLNALALVRWLEAQQGVRPGRDC
jgi:glutamate carboxypeptidase